jgi:hypothetical protein
MNEQLELQPMTFFEEIETYCADILVHQASLNELYNKDWKSISIHSVVFAVKEELVEMNRELTHIWKFWGSKKANYSNALEEFIDVLHFSAFMVLLNEDVLSRPYQKPYINGVFKDFSAESLCSTLAVGNRSKELILLNRINTAAETLKSTFPRFDCTLPFLFLFGCVFFDMTPSQMYVGYLFKNNKNKNRTLKGATVKDIDKTSEMSVYQYLQSSNIVFETEEEYNLRMVTLEGRKY